MRIDSNGNATFPNWQDVLMNEMDKRKLTIKNPESLNTNNNHIKGEWVIEYMGRDLSLSEDNYRWDIHNGYTGIRGYYIIERELINEGDWVYVRWGRIGVKSIGKERKETISKVRLGDKNRIRKDMINVIENSPY